MSIKSNRVLSIQSHVAHGYVGNKSAAFPLQVLGFEFDNINSVQFSNHTGYEHGFKGQVLDESELLEVFSGLVANNIHSLYTHLLTGYVRNGIFLREIINVLKTLRKANPDLIYVCDPVMGDDGCMYVPEELLPIYRDEIIPLADVVTPNQFEVELLTGISIKTEQDAWNAVEWFHEKGVKVVSISSSVLGTSDTLLALVSLKKGSSIQRYRLNIPILGNGIRFTGTGDLFAALFLAHFTLTEQDVCITLERTVATLQAVIRNTLAEIPADVRDGKISVTSMQRELKIIQSKRDIENPNVSLRCAKV